MDIYTEASTNKAAGQTKRRTASFQGGTYVARMEGIALADICAEGGWDAEICGSQSNEVDRFRRRRSIDKAYGDTYT